MREPAALRVGGWRVWLPSAGGAAEAAAWVAAAEKVMAEGDALHRSTHAETYRWRGAGGDVYVKVYRCHRGRTAAKNLMRPSKARNVLRLSARLALVGFRVPRVLAAGEERLGRWRRHSWVATAALGGEPLTEHLAALLRARGLREAPESISGADAHRGTAEEPPRARGLYLKRKRALLRVIGAEVARLHVAGFVAGDLVPTNVWTVAEPGGVAIALLDHDRTCGGRFAAPWWRARRNLVQLNRMVLPGITVSDRLRVYRAYASGRGWSWQAACRRLPWVVAKTIERRCRCDGIALPPRAGVSFHELMRASGPYAPRKVARVHIRHGGAQGGARCAE
jgi:hypothetical protein